MQVPVAGQGRVKWGLNLDTCAEKPKFDQDRE